MHGKRYERLAEEEEVFILPNSTDQPDRFPDDGNHRLMNDGPVARCSLAHLSRVVFVHDLALQIIVYSLFLILAEAVEVFRSFWDYPTFLNGLSMFEHPWDVGLVEQRCHTCWLCHRFLGLQTHCPDEDQGTREYLRSLLCQSRNQIRCHIHVLGEKGKAVI